MLDMLRYKKANGVASRWIYEAWDGKKVITGYYLSLEAALRNHPDTQVEYESFSEYLKDLQERVVPKTLIEADIDGNCDD